MLLTALVVWQGLGVVTQTLASVGWRVFWLPLYYLIPILCAALSWRHLFVRNQEPPLRIGLYTTWLCLSINWLLPVAQIGGEIARVRLLVKRGIPTSNALAVSVIGDETLQLSTQIVYTLMGVSLFVYEQTNHQLVIGALASVSMLGIAGFAFYQVQRAGMFRLFARIAKQFLSASSGESMEQSAVKVDRAVKAMYSRVNRLAIAISWRFGFRILLAGEVWLALNFLGHPVSFVEATILESIGQGVRGAAFAIPGGLGAQEGGFMLVGTALGLPPQIALALSLCKRVRELVLGVPGLMVWQLEEGTRVFALQQKD